MQHHLIGYVLLRTHISGRLQLELGDADLAVGARSGIVSSDDRPQSATPAPCHVSSDLEVFFPEQHYPALKKLEQVLFKTSDKHGCGHDDRHALLKHVWTVGHETVRFLTADCTPKSVTERLASTNSLGNVFQIVLEPAACLVRSCCLVG